MNVFAHQLQELIGVEWLLQDGAGHHFWFVDLRGESVSRDGDDGEFGTSIAQLAYRIDAAPVWHHQIGNHALDL